MQSHPKINLVYVASIAFSGTTLFESILGAHSQLATCGEIQIWPHEILQGGVMPTGSGRFVQESPFWNEMQNRVRPLRQAEPRIHFFRELHHAGRTLRSERLRDFGPRPLPAETAQKVHQYGLNNYELFKAFLDLVEETTSTRPRWVVDASKDPYRLLWLVRSGLFNVKVFHLVKSPQGFAYSVTKRHVNQDDRLRDVKRLYYTARKSLTWIIQNHLFTMIAKNHLQDRDYMLIQYEELAAHPRETFEKACAVIGCPYEEQAVDEFQNGSPFAIAGNPMRHDHQGIKLDERWKRHLPPPSQHIARLITSVNKAHYGY